MSPSFSLIQFVAVDHHLNRMTPSDTGIEDVKAGQEIANWWSANLSSATSDATS
ncbi:hypothetical protein RISK_005302 [Rhodopirellula islandica]|uniref:Uncharacterized protein n=1 Tax=Rhodopirellula islandica TaxID=595434 RepID=A0A0J1B6X4_RHOIS|nr:hypothetical protein RISK_005302 [Rhodopirellula islandica]